MRRVVAHSARRWILTNSACLRLVASLALVGLAAPQPPVPFIVWLQCRFSCTCSLSIFLRLFELLRPDQCRILRLMLRCAPRPRQVW